MFILAGHLGMTVERMLDEMSSAEYVYWIAEYARNPFGVVRGDIQTAIIAQQTDLLLQQNAGNKGIKLRDITDFMPFAKVEKEVAQEGSPEALLESFIQATGQSPPGK